MSAKQRDFVAALVAEQQELMRRMVEMTEPRGSVTAEMIAEALQDFSPAHTVRAIQSTLNQTGNPRVVIDALIASRDALRARARQIAAKRSAPQAQTAEDGATYRASNGSVFHCYMGQRSGRLLLKLWDATEKVFSYYAAATRLPAGSVKLTKDECAEFGRATGTCCVCMRHLTNDDSVAAGIGPVCASKF